jgi:poly-gamma-glutamate synthesis protein (capsule biosynthesis protein)
VAADLGQAGFTVMTVATNHTCDYGPVAFMSTLDHLRNSGITPVGGGKDLAEALTPAFFVVNGLKIAVIAVSCLVPADYAATPERPGIAPLHVDQWTEFHPLMMMTEPGAPLKMRSKVRHSEQDKLTSLISTLRGMVDFVLVSVHWGYGRGYPQAEYQRPLAHSIIDSGADMILGNHPHSPAGIEMYRGKPILYSLGNHIAQHEWENATPYQKEIFALIDPWSLVARFTFSAGKVEAMEFMATKCDDQGMPNLIIDRSEAEPVLSSFALLSKRMGAEIIVNDNKATLNLE